MTSSSIGLIAGSGEYPVFLAERLRREGVKVRVAGIHGHADSERYAACEFGYFYAGEIARSSAWLRAGGVSTAMLAGGYAPRPLRDKFKPDAAVVTALPLLLFGGDDRRLRYLADLYSRNGISIVDPGRWIRDLFVPSSFHCGPPLKADTLSLIERGKNICSKFMTCDKGQAVLTHHSGWVGYEGRKGTDALLSSAFGPGCVLIKMKKTSQDMRFDIPTIGPRTVALAHEVKVAAIAVEANAVVMLQSKETCRQSRMLNVSILSF